MVPICDCLGWNLCIHLNICWKTPIHFAALDDTSELSQKAGKRKIGETSDAPLAKRPHTTLRKVPSLRVDQTESEHTMPRIPPLSWQQSLYMIEGFRTWTTGVQPFTTVSHWIDRWHFHAYSELLNVYMALQIARPITWENSQEAVQGVLSRCVKWFDVPCNFWPFSIKSLVYIRGYNLYFYRANGDSLTVHEFESLLAALGAQLPQDLPCPQTDAEIADVRAQLYCGPTYPQRTAEFWGM